MEKRNKGVFYFITKDGEVSDEGIANEMLKNEKVIRKDLIRLGIIREFKAKVMKPSKASSKRKGR